MVLIPILIDLSYFYSLTKGDGSFGNVLLSGTLNEIDLLMKDFEFSLGRRDAIGVRKNVHSLVSLSAIAGMPQVSSWSSEMDQLFSDGIFHPEMLNLAYQIINEWPFAKYKIENHLVI